MPFWHKLSHLFKGSLKFLNLATFRLKKLGKLERKDDFKIVAVVGKRKVNSEPYEFLWFKKYVK